jgi:hypothetical protein
MHTQRVVGREDVPVLAHVCEAHDGVGRLLVRLACGFLRKHILFRACYVNRGLHIDHESQKSD